MTLVVGVSFTPQGKLHDYDATEFPALTRHDGMVVSWENSRVMSVFAVVESAPRLQPPSVVPGKPFLRVLRRTSPEDYACRE